MLKSLLWGLSKLYQLGILLRHAAYDHRFFASKKVPAVVISIGNIVAGGVGKTPLVHFLAEDISKKYSTAILSRGYRSKAEHRKSSTRVESAMTAEEVGDEPLWLARKLPLVQVWVGKNRALSAKKAIAQGAEVLLLDDGFQHRSLYRDLDVVVVDGEAPLDNGHFLPRGHLRDLPSRLSKADFLAVMGKALKNVPKAITFTRNAGIDVQGKKVALFCAIGNPHRFVQQMQEKGAQIVGSFFKSDHASFSLREIERLYQESKAEMLVCTEKDFIKLPKTKIPVVAIPMGLQISQGHEIWAQLIEKIQIQVNHVRRSQNHAS